MKMMNNEMEFVTFGAQDVIMTSTGGGGGTGGGGNLTSFFLAEFDVSTWENHLIRDANGNSTTLSMTDENSNPVPTWGYTQSIYVTLRGTSAYSHDSNNSKLTLYNVGWAREDLGIPEGQKLEGLEEVVAWLDMNAAGQRAQ